MKIDKDLRKCRDYTAEAEDYLIRAYNLISLASEEVPIKWYRMYKDTGTPPNSEDLTTSEGPTIHYPTDPYGGPTFYC